MRKHYRLPTNLTGAWLAASIVSPEESASKRRVLVRLAYERIVSVLTLAKVNRCRRCGIRWPLHIFKPCEILATLGSAISFMPLPFPARRSFEKCEECCPLPRMWNASPGTNVRAGRER